MIKKLQRKFIVVAMCAVTAVLAVVMAAACVISYVNLNQEFDQKLSMLAANDGRFPLGLSEEKHGKLEIKPEAEGQLEALIGGSKTE